MAEIVNLRMARKRKARADKEARGAENRALHGLTKAERSTRRLENERAVRTLDAHRRDWKDNGNSDG